MSYVLHMAEMPHFEDQLEYYEVRHTETDKRSLCVNKTVKDYYDLDRTDVTANVKGNFEDPFTLQSVCFEHFPDDHDVGIHQMTTFLDKEHDMINSVCIVSSTYKGVTQSNVYIDTCYHHTMSRACQLYGSWCDLPVGPMKVQEIVQNMVETLIQ